MTYAFEPIGVIHSCFKEKFGIPRQPGLASEATATLELFAPYNSQEALAELAGFSHIWLVFVFHQALREGWRLTVRPPRLGGNQRIGVFASRAPFRPNPIGLSAVQLEGINCQDGRCRLRLRGADLLDGTPVLDVKPYIPYADALPEAVAGYAAQPPAVQFKVVFSAAAEAQCVAYERARYPALRRLIEQILQTDPRPAYRHGQNDGQCYGMRLYDFDLRWRIDDGQCRVLGLEPLDSGGGGDN
jgi:tRNA-Thr(GGU) m(6)t(6)A37 methyltransferase TsaA